MSLAKIWAAAIIAVVLCSDGLCSDGAIAADYEHVSSVVISRHGVRSPTNTRPPLASIAAEPWPSWPVPPGYLTPRGAELARLLGGYYRGYFAAQGLIPAQGCPPPGDVFAWEDVDERTELTGQSLLEGMFPGCNLKPEHLAGAKIDPLFHPTRAGVCRIDSARARQAVLHRAGGNFAAMQSRYRSEIAAIQSVLKCCGPPVCRAAGVAGSCGLGDLATTVVGSNDGGSVRLSGPIAIGSTAAEVFLLQYAQGFPDDQVAWGRASTPEALRPLLRLHTLQFDLIQRPPYLAARQGSALVQRVLTTMRRDVDGGGRVDRGPPAGRKLTLLVGHDTNLANVAGMLGISWSLPSSIPNETPPAGALHFDLLRDRHTGAHAVRVKYIAQTLDQMRRAAPLDRANPPEEATAAIGCATDGVCPWTAFETLANGAIDRACVPMTPR